MIKGKICVSCLHFCCRAGFFSSNVITAIVVETRVSGYPLFMIFVLNCEMAVSYAVSEDFVFIEVWQLEKCVY